MLVQQYKAAIYATLISDQTSDEQQLIAMSSLWFQRTQREASISADSVREDLTSICTVAGSDLPLLAPEHLSFDKTLGKGSSFVVNREIYSRFPDVEPYYVAVKRMIVADQPLRRLQQHYDKVLRELRVLTHPNLKDNQYILTILACGWTDSPKGRWPYLVVDYSHTGTLNEYLSRFETTFTERQEYSLDVALGLKALHENNIIHGDVKPNNILLFESWGTVRHSMAKISDFSGTIFDLRDNRMVGYGGTNIYNAPEQERRGKYKSQIVFAPEQLYQADMYSFGITLWEIMKRGKSYIDDEWLLQGETRIEFLNRIHEEEEDPILHRAEAFCESLFFEFVYDLVLDCFRMTLRDKASQRSDITQIISRLTKRNSIDRPVPRAYPGRWSPGPINCQKLDYDPKPSRGGYRLIPHCTNSAVFYVDESNTGCRELDTDALDDASKDTDKGIIARLTKPNSSESSNYELADLDLFQATLMPTLPWHVQCEAVRIWHAEAASKNSPKRYQASLQLAICYHIGYGVRPDLNLMLHYLTTSLEGNDTTRVLYYWLISAMNVEVNQHNLDMIYMTDLDRRLKLHELRETYFAARVRQHQQLQLKKKRNACQTADCTQRGILKLVELVIRQEISLVTGLLSSNTYDNADISCALREASRCGNAGMVQLICAYCDKFVHDERLTTPLHWLIMFEESEVATVAKVLMCGASADHVGPCKANINSIPTSESGTLFIAEHCLELFGTPLHWAVRTRNLKLVELLVKLGADINARTEVPTAPVTNLHKPLRPSLSPLDIAVAFHLPEIVARLLDLGANWEGRSSLSETHSAFLCIGLACVPFSRYIIHGKQYRDALKETVGVLDERGYNINDADVNGYDPLKVALSNADCESYIIEELLIAGAIPSQGDSRNPESAIDIVVGHAPYRRYSVENLRLVLPYVRNVKCRQRTYNAIQTAAVGGSEAMVELLSTAKGFDIDATTMTRNDSKGGGMTALHLAAFFGHSEVISLLVRKGANMEIPDAFTYTPLQTATFHRKINAIDTLIELGANVLFKSLRHDTVLHVAVAGIWSGHSIVKHLLLKHTRLQEHSIINVVDHIGWTALHKAAYFGHELWRLSIGAWDIDLKRIMAGGSQAMDCHKANLHEILLMLKDDDIH